MHDIYTVLVPLGIKSCKANNESKMICNARHELVFWWDGAETTALNDSTKCPGGNNSIFLQYVGMFYKMEYEMRVYAWCVTVWGLNETVLCMPTFSLTIS